MSAMGTGGEGAREQGSALLKLGRFTEAATALRRAVDETPDDEAAWQLLGSALSSGGDASGAVSAFERALALSPGSPKNHYNVAVALQADNKLYEAKSHLEQALALSPGYEPAKAALAALASQGTARSYGTSASREESPEPSAPTNSGGNDLTPVGGSAGAYATPSVPSMAANEGSAVPNLGASPYGGATAFAPVPVLGQYGQSENTSGQKSTVPVELQGGWNWGAFWFGWLWLVNHKLVGAGIGLLVGSFVLGLIPVVNILAALAGFGVAIYLGIIGNRLGWQNRPFNSVEDFKACQRVWGFWVLGSFLFSVVIGVAAVLLALAQEGRGVN